MTHEIFQLIGSSRNSPRGFDASTIVREIEKQGLAVTDDEIREIVNSRDGGGFIPPKRVIDFVMRLTSGRQISTALEFGCGVVGFLGKALEQQKAKVKALTPNVECAALSRLLCKGTAVEVDCAAPLAWLEKTELRFDFVFGMPPFGLKAETPLPFLQETPRRNIDSAIAHAAWAGSCLADDGIAVLVVPTGFAEIQSNQAVETLTACGLNLIAYLSLPSGIFLPHSSVAAALAVVARKGTGRIFVGSVSDDANRNDAFIRNFKNGREGSDVGTGRLVAQTDFRGVRVLEAKEKVDRTAARLGLAPNRLQDILETVNLTKASEPPGFEEQPNAVYLPMIGRGDAVTSVGQLRMKPHNYAQLLVKSSVVDPEYLAGFFNTPLGLSIREQSTSGVTIPKLTKMTITQMTVFLPDLTTQRSTVRTQTRLREASAELREFEKRLWEQPGKCEAVAKATERFERKEALSDWIDTLPFPLGSILWAYQTCGADNRKRYDHLLDFFEAYGEFLATILLSAFWRDEELLEAELKKLGEGAAKQGFSFLRAAFGTWMRTVERLGSTCRQFLQSSDNRDRLRGMLCINDDDVIGSLISVRATQILNKANKRRNDWRHSKSVVSEGESEARHTEMRGYLIDLRECMGVAWDRYELILPGKSEFLGDVNLYSIERVRGRCAPFEKAETELAHQMKKGTLHLKAQDERRALELLPLIKILSSPESVQNACYFYNKQESEGIKFVSYHFDSEIPITKDFPDTLHVITRLSAAVGQAANH